MSKIEVFKNEEFGVIRTVEVNGKVMFCGKDVATALGYTNTKKAILDHCKEDGVTFCDLIDSLGRTQQAKFISEGNVYRLVCSSELPNAEKFESWVFDEVLPSIRKNGTYTTPQMKSYGKKLTSVGEVASLIKVLRSVMKDQKSDPQKIAEMTEGICKQFGVNLPTQFVEKHLFDGQLYLLKL